MSLAGTTAHATWRWNTSQTTVRGSGPGAVGRRGNQDNEPPVGCKMPRMVGGAPPSGVGPGPPGAGRIGLRAMRSGRGWLDRRGRNAP